MILSKRMLTDYLSQWLGKAVEVTALTPLGVATVTKSVNEAEVIKAFGYGKPIAIDFYVKGEKQIEKQNEKQRVVLHHILPNSFGREREPDRVAEVWLNYTTFSQLPRHVPALDVVAVTKQGELQSIGQVEEMILLSGYVPGQPYAADLMRMRDQGICTAQDLDRARRLAHYLAEIHQSKPDQTVDRPALWRRRLRDLIGHGEGMMGLTDSYPADFSLSAPAQSSQPIPQLLQSIEEAANRWRWKLKPLSHRLTQVHGDFHPFNILFDPNPDCAPDQQLYLLDRSRGEWGEAADDVSCLAINYLFFSLQANGGLSGPFAQLHQTFWESYLAKRSDPELLRVIQPWFAWRTLVLASPQWYPTQTQETRRKLFNFAQHVLACEEFDWRRVNEYL